MKILPISPRPEKYLIERNITKQFKKQKKFFEQNQFHQSLGTEILKPRHLKIYSFRITDKYRAIFIYTGNNQIEIVDINNHYQ